MSFDFAYLRQRLDTLSEQQRRRSLVARIPRGPGFVQDGRSLINFGSNDYLGLVADSGERLLQNPLTSSVGSGASALVSGWTDRHEQLAQRIKELESTEAAVVFPSGYAACSGTLATLAESDDLILSDALNHASLIDGSRLARSRCVVYPHRDVEFVRRTLRSTRSDYRRVWIVTDGVFSMDGCAAPLPQLCDLADQYQAHLIVDEAHGTGVLGTDGSGICEALDVKHRVPIRIGTLSKAIGSQGGFVAGPSVVVDYLVNRCRSLIFSTALAPPAVEASIRGIESIAGQPERRRRVQSLAHQVRQHLSIDCSPWEASIPIVPLILGADRAAVDASAALSEAGFFVPAIRPPSVPEGTSRLRICLSAAHSDRMVAELLETIDQIGGR